MLGMIIALTLAGKQEPPVFTPPNFDAAAQSGTPAVPSNLGWSEIYQDGMGYTVHVCGKVIVNDGSADVYFANDRDNAVWLKLRITDEKGAILGETGLIKPDEYVRSVTLRTVPEDGSKVKMKIMAYEPDTYYSAGSVSLQTTIRVGGQ